MLSKPIDDITYADIEEMCRRGAEEGPRLEFKSVFDRGANSPTLLKDAKLKEFAAVTAVAFANTDGGNLVIGIKEDRTPAGRDRAAAPEPHPDCITLAGSIRDALEQVIQPRLRGLRVKPVSEAGGATAGVVVVSVPRSLSAPHAVGEGVDNCTLRAFRRVERGSRRMTMGDVQDMTLRLAREGDRIDKRLSDLPRHIPNGQALGGATFLLWTAFVAIDPVSLNVLGDASFAPLRPKNSALTLGQRSIVSIDDRWGTYQRQETPTVRGLRRYKELPPDRDGDYGRVQLSEGLFNDGAGFFAIRYFETEREQAATNYRFDAAIAISTVALATQVVKSIRASSSSPEVRFAFRFSLETTRRMRFTAPATDHSNDRLLQPHTMPLPDYEASPELDDVDLLRRFVSDLYNAFGCAAPEVSNFRFVSG